MRAKDFVINVTVPVTITIPADFDSTPDEESIESSDHTFVPPLQQKIELMKSTAGKQSAVINQLTANDDDILED